MRPWILLWIGLGKSEWIEVIELIQGYVILCWYYSPVNGWGEAYCSLNGWGNRWVCYHVPGHIGSKDWDWEDIFQNKYCILFYSLLLSKRFVHSFNRVFVEHLLQARHCTITKTVTHKADSSPALFEITLWTLNFMAVDIFAFESCSLCGQRCTLKQWYSFRVRSNWWL